MTHKMLDPEKLVEITDAWFQLAKMGMPKRGQWAQIIRTRIHGTYLELLQQHQFEIARAVVYSVHVPRQPFATMRGFTDLEKRPPAIGELYRIVYLPGRWFTHIPGGFNPENYTFQPPSLCSECWIEKFSKREMLPM